jgi:ligand-binding sensor domain-containing protein
MLKIKLNLLFAFLLATTKLISQAVTTYLPPAGYNLTQIRNCNTICTNSNGTEAYIGYRDIGLQKLETSTQTWTAFDTTNSGIASNNVTVVKFNSLNQLWIGTRNAGLSNFTGTTWTNYSTQNSALCNDTVLSLLPMATGLWVGTQNGLSFFNGASFTNYTTSNSGIVGNKINCLETDGSGNLYVGTSSGFSIFNGTVWSNTSISNSSLMSDTVTKIQYINANACWILTARGLAKKS